jgi:hypothetical protein
MGFDAITLQIRFGIHYPEFDPVDKMDQNSGPLQYSLSDERSPYMDTVSTDTQNEKGILYIHQVY